MATPIYSPRRPETTVLYQVVAEHLETLLAEGPAPGRSEVGFPSYVIETFRSYLDCGIWARGFCRVVCEACRAERLVPFACKMRGLCPSCQARRAADCAAHLVDHVLPDAGYRQWTLSVPRRLRVPMARNPQLLSRVLREFTRELFCHFRRVARRLGIAKPKPAAFTFIQRFGSLLHLHPHFHLIALDGVFARDASAKLVLHPLEAPDDLDVQRLVERVALRVLRMCESYDQSASDPSVDVDDEDEQGMAEASEHAIANSKPSTKPEIFSRKTGRRSWLCAGFSLHADTATAVGQRQPLEHLIRYGARPSFAASRLSITPSGKVRYRLGKPHYDGRTEVVLDPLTFLRRLSTLIPPPRIHSLRFPPARITKRVSGAFAPAAKIRAEVVAMVPLCESDSSVEACATPKHSASGTGTPALLIGPAPDTPSPAAQKTYRLPWASLLRRVFSTDVLECSECQGRMRLIAIVTEPAVITKILAHLNLPTKAPSIAPARAPPQLEIWD